MDTQLYLRVRGRVLGPFDQEKLQALVRRGQLSRMHQVSTDGTHWVQASTYAELFVGAPVKLVVPEMPVASPPPAQSPANDPSIPFLKDPVVVSQPASKEVVPAETGRSWYYESRGAGQGPVDESVLRQMLATGQLGAEYARLERQHDSMDRGVAGSRPDSRDVHQPGETWRRPRAPERTTAWRVFASRPWPRALGPCSWRSRPLSTPACAFSSAS